MEKCHGQKQRNVRGKWKQKEHLKYEKESDS